MRYERFFSHFNSSVKMLYLCCKKPDILSCGMRNASPLVNFYDPLVCLAQDTKPHSLLFLFSFCSVGLSDDNTKSSRFSFVFQKKLERQPF